MYIYKNVNKYILQSNLLTTIVYLNFLCALLFHYLLTFAHKSVQSLIYGLGDIP